RVLGGYRDRNRGVGRVYASGLSFRRLQFQAQRLLLIGQTEQLIVGGRQVAFFIQIADYQFRRSVHIFVDVQRTQLPHQVVGQGRGLGQKVLERRLLAVFHLNRSTKSGIEIFREERAKIDFVERVLFLGGGFGLLLLVGGQRTVAVHLLFARGNFV